MAGFLLDSVHGLKTDSCCKWWMVAIGHKLPFICPQKDAQRILLKENNEKEFK